jgi:uncharacterized membrane protein (UPF0127 family)
LKYKKRNLSISKFKRLGPIGKFTGLMFKSKETDILLFPFTEDTKMPIHSYFVFFSFLAVWTDSNNKVLEFRIVSPFTSIVYCRSRFRNLIEIPINSKNKKIIEFFVGKGNI